mgnify:CR=1 FL=1
MDAFTYTDIFDTKGIEYIVVIAFLLILIPTWIWLNKPVAVKENLLRSVSGLSAEILSFPRGLFYNRNHTWTYMEKSGDARVGVDDLLLHLTGGVSVDFLKKPGEKVNKGELIATVSRDDRRLKIASPISGEIRKVNTALSDKEGEINADPYGKGWLLKMHPEHWREETHCCRMDDEVETWSKEELERCKDFLASTAKSSAGTADVVLQAGGELTDFPLAEMPPEVWNKFQQEFLD